MHRNKYRSYNIIKYPAVKRLYNTGKEERLEEHLLFSGRNVVDRHRGGEVANGEIQPNGVSLYRTDLLVFLMINL